MASKHVTGQQSKQPTRTRSGGGHTSKGWHQRLPRVKHSWSSQKEDDRGEGHETAGKIMYRDGTMRWESRWQMWTTGSRRDVRLYKKNMYAMKMKKHQQLSNLEISDQRWMYYDCLLLWHHLYNVRVERMTSVLYSIPVYCVQHIELDHLSKLMPKPKEYTTFYLVWIMI